MTFRDSVILRHKKHSSEFQVYDHLSEAYSRAIAAHIFLFDSKLGSIKQYCVVERAQALKSNRPRVHPVFTA